MKRLTKYPILVNAFEAGALIALISNSGRRDDLEGVFRQLLDLQGKFQLEAGVTVTELEDGRIKMVHRDGSVVIRKRHDWERMPPVKREAGRSQERR